MSVTREQVAEAAKTLGVTLTDAEVEGFVKDGKLPEKKETNSGTAIDDLVSKYSHRQIAAMLKETEAESIARKHKIRSLEEVVEAANKAMEAAKKDTTRLPELEAANKVLQERLQANADGERKRREQMLGKLPEEKRGVLDFMLNVDTVSPDKFDQAIALHITTKGNGADAPPPGGDPPVVNPWKRETRNLTLQAKMMREDPGTAARLKQAAGVA
jgi:hypothetical protein